MPTPESESFKAQKPRVPPSFDYINYDDHPAYLAAQDAVIRSQWVDIAMRDLVKKELNKCWRENGVNHLEMCGHLRERYLQLLKSARVTGTMGLQRHSLPPVDDKSNKA